MLKQSLKNLDLKYLICLVIKSLPVNRMPSFDGIFLFVALLHLVINRVELE